MTDDIRQAVSNVVTETIAVLLSASVSLPNVVTMRAVAMPPSVLCYALYETDENQMTIIGLNPDQSPILFDGDAVSVLRV